MAIYYPGNILSTTEKTTSSSSASGMWSMPAHVQKTKSGSWPGITPAAAASDTYFNLTTLLLHGDGTNNANNTVFVDSSTNALTVTTNGKPYQGTFSPFSQTGWSNYFNGSSDYLTTPSNAAYAFGTGDFTLEFWFRSTDTNAGLVVPASAQGTGYWALILYLGSLYWQSSFGQTNLLITSASSITDGSWHHVAVVRSSSTSKIYFDGVQQVSASDSTNYTFVTSGLQIASDNLQAGSGGYLNGYISNLRIVKGTAVYTSAFTPPTTPLTAVSGTSLLICQDNRFKDNSTNTLTITPNGTPSVQPFSPFAPSAGYSTSTVGGSTYFSGTSTDYLNGASSASLAFSGDFTIEGWFYLTGTNNQGSSGEQGILGSGTTTGSKWTVRLQGTSTKLMSWWLNGPANNVAGSTAIKQNTWYHFALVRSGSSTNNVKLYLNGVLESQGTSTYSITQDVLEIGRSYSNLSSEYFNGYISNVRLLNTALYASNFTPATSPFTTISNTQFLLSGTNAGIFDQTAKNNLTTSTAAVVSTTQSNFGGSSLSFTSASSSYLQMLSSNFNTIPASTNFTLECWVYTAASNLAPAVWHNTSSSKIVAFFLTDSAVNTLYTIAGTLNYPSPNVAVVRATTNIVDNTWTHVAFVRSGSTITIYINGTAAGTGTSSYASNPLQLIGAISTSTTPNFYFFNGYIDDLRLTIGVARYTSNFTAPTSAFADQ